MEMSLGYPEDLAEELPAQIMPMQMFFHTDPEQTCQADPAVWA